MIDIKKKITEQYKIPSNTVDGAFIEISNLVYLI